MYIGQDKYETITNQYFRQADVIWIVLDLTDEEGIDSLKRYWIPRAFEYATKPHVQAILIGNKYDIIEQILQNDQHDFDELKQKYEDYIKPKVHRLISKYKFPYFEISAKTGYNVTQVFMNVTTAFLRNIAQQQLDNQKKLKSPSSSKSKKGKKRRKKLPRDRNYYKRESSFSREESITLDSKDLDFTKKNLENDNSGRCC